jgi:hypothetical protein
MGPSPSVKVFKLAMLAEASALDRSKSIKNLAYFDRLWGQLVDRTGFAWRNFSSGADDVGYFAAFPPNAAYKVPTQSAPKWIKKMIDRDPIRWNVDWH